jgi:hypothetical protein
MSVISQDIQAALSRMQARANQDPPFHALCFEDPVRAFREAAGAELPEGLSLRCLPVEQAEVLVPLPGFQEVDANQELSDAELDAVAGGSPDFLAVPYLVAEVGGVFTAFAVALGAAAGVSYGFYKLAEILPSDGGTTSGPAPSGGGSPLHYK